MFSGMGFGLSYFHFEVLTGILCAGVAAPAALLGFRHGLRHDVAPSHVAAHGLFGALALGFSGSLFVLAAEGLLDGTDVAPALLAGGLHLSVNLAPAVLAAALAFLVSAILGQALRGAVGFDGGAGS